MLSEPDFAFGQFLRQPLIQRECLLEFPQFALASYKQIHSAIRQVFLPEQVFGLSSIRKVSQEVRQYFFTDGKVACSCHNISVQSRVERWLRRQMCKEKWLFPSTVQT